MFLPNTIFEDLGYSWQLLSLSTDIYCLPEKLYYYRSRLGSIMHTAVERKEGKVGLDFLKIARDCLSFWRAHAVRQKYSSGKPAYFELEILNRSRDAIARWAADEYHHEAWIDIRNMIGEFELGARLQEFPDLALYYHLPPCAHKQLEDVRKKETALLAHGKHIYRMYHFYQLLIPFSWGARR